jgi:PhnB protein
MASRLNPYISFRDNAREALEFYQQVFGGELSVMTFGDMGTPADAPESSKVMHGMLETKGGFTLMAADTPPGMEVTNGDNISVSLSGDDDAELRGYWDQLSSSGNVGMALEKQMWGDVFGMCTDRFGIIWLVNISQPQG